MTLSNKYGSCGCSVGCTTSCGSSTCCNSTVQTAPAPCCESHEISYQAGVCLKPAFNVVASTGTFTIKFSNVCDTLPIDSNNVFFHHPATGLLQVVGVDQYDTYQVNLVDSTKAGGLISAGDCVLIAVVPASSFTSNTRCLSGNFTAPAISANETIYIENGSSIPIGSTVTFTANGDTGSYVVVSFVSASGNIYAWEVQNTGNGHVPGTIIAGGAAGSCTVPIELITNVDQCSLSVTSIADTISACVGGSPRALVSDSSTSTIVGDGSGGWTQGNITNIDCCVVTSGALKLTGDTCTTGSDIVVLDTTNIPCLEAAWDEVLAADISGTGQHSLPMNIAGFDVVMTNYVGGTRTATFEPSDKDALAGGLILDYPAGTQICLGECCESCVNGPKFTNHKLLPGNPLGEEYATVLNWSTSLQLEYETGVKHHYLIGHNNASPLATVVLEIDATYDDDPEGGPGKPVLSDPLLFRNKICNEDLNGCDQYVELEWNYEMIFDPLPAGVRVHWELAHFASGSATLADGSTPNPFNTVSTQSAAAGYIEGPTSTDAFGLIGATAIGFGGAGVAKIFPYIAGVFRDRIYLEKCNCALSMVWHYVQVEVISGAPPTTSFNTDLNVRQLMTFHNANERTPPRNNPLSEGFNLP